MVDLGALTAGVIASVDGSGCVRRGDVVFDWRVRTNEWITPSAMPATSVRHRRVGVAPIAETAVRIPGGEAVHRAYALGDIARSVVVEVENASPEAIAIGFSISGGPAVCSWPREPGAVEPDGLTVFPVPHRTRVRVAVGDAAVDARALADIDAVTRAWDRILERGMRTELPDDLQERVDAARVDTLLAPPAADAFVALEDWGFDDEAAAMWPHLRGAERRRVRRRAITTGVLGEVRAALVHADDHGHIDVLPGFRTEWLGQSIAAHEVPLRQGRVSFALRWHGARPALLWDVPAGSTVRAPTLDPAWSTTDPVGETLLAEPAGVLLAMGHAEREGEALDEPGSFS